MQISNEARERFFVAQITNCVDNLRVKVSHNPTIASNDVPKIPKPSLPSQAGGGEDREAEERVRELPEELQGGRRAWVSP
jgi:hypothetical protein